MRRATIALRSAIGTVASAVGLEGAFLVTGTAVLAYGAGLVSPVGPYLVVGSMCILAGLALAVPIRRQ